MSGDCDFLSANLYARSVFGEPQRILVSHVSSSRAETLFISFLGEDALANLSIEKTDTGSITGHVRIRSKTQGIALSLGDRITLGK